MQWWGGREVGEALDSRERRTSYRGFSLEIVYTLTLSDLVWMYLGSWAARMAAAPGFLCVVFCVAGWPSAGIPIASYLEILGACLVFMALGPLLFLLGALGMYGSRRFVGTTVRLSIDDQGVRGWPLAKEMRLTWAQIRRVRSVRGVITLPFRHFGTRAGWVPVPERAMTAGQLTDFLSLLADKGVL